jgi:HK97 family phage prohead protease
MGYGFGGYITCVSSGAAAPASIKQSGPPAPRRQGWLVLGGVGTVYNLAHPANIGHYWQQDVFAPGCFTKYINAGRNTSVHRMHNHQKSYGSTGDESLRLVDTAEALIFRLKLDEDDMEAVKLFNDVASRALPGASVGFGAVNWDFRDLGDGKKTRVITESWLGEISAVTYPAVPGSTTAALDERCGRLQLGFERLSAFASELASAQVSTNLRRLRDLLESAE